MSVLEYLSVQDVSSSTGLSVSTIIVGCLEKGIDIFVYGPKRRRFTVDADCLQYFIDDSLYCIFFDEKKEMVVEDPDDSEEDPIEANINAYNMFMRRKDAEELIDSNNPSKKQPIPTGEVAERTNLLIIAGLVDLLKDQYKSEEDIIMAFTTKIPKALRCSDTTLRKRLTLAKRVRDKKGQEQDD